MSAIHGLLAVFTTLVVLGAAVVIVMLIVKAIAHKQKVRQETIRMMLDRGVYDYRLIYGKKKGYASLGWGIVFVAIGFGMLVGFISLGLIREGLMGSSIVLLLGVGLIVYHVMTRTDRDADNEQPIIIKPTGDESRGGAAPPRPHTDSTSLT